MSVVQIHASKSGGDTVGYVLGKNNDRCLEVSATNMLIGNEINEMKEFWKDNRIHVYHIKQSFHKSVLDPNKLEDIWKANDIGLAIAKKIYPDKQVLIGTQTDGKGGCIHNHIIVNSIGFRDNKALRGDRKQWTVLHKKIDEIVREHKLPIVQEITSKKRKRRESIGEIEMNIADEKRYSWKEDLCNRIDSLCDDISICSHEDFSYYMKQTHNVEVRYRGEGLSFSFTDKDGEKRKVKASKLGADYGKDRLEEAFKENKAKQFVQKIENESIVSLTMLESEFKKLKPLLNKNGYRVKGFVEEGEKEGDPNTYHFEVEKGDVAKIEKAVEQYNEQKRIESLPEPPVSEETHPLHDDMREEPAEQEVEVPENSIQGMESTEEPYISEEPGEEPGQVDEVEEKIEGVKEVSEDFGDKNLSMAELKEWMKDNREPFKEQRKKEKEEKIKKRELRKKGRER